MVASCGFIIRTSSQRSVTRQARVAARCDVAAINSALNLENIETSFNISATKSDTGHELALLPRTGAMKRVFQKLDLRINDKFRVEGTDMLLPNGDRIVTTYSNQTRAPIPPSTFEFKPPTGTEVTTPLGQ